jgi:type II restriction/modification system DNA methylase subunit YeeA
MTPEEFIALWKNNPLTERAGAQAWFDDLCELLGVAKPRDPDNYCFERGAGKSGGGDGWADVWMRGRFGWENKKPGRDLPAALKQLTDYFLQLDNPPLLVVADRERIVIHTAFTGYPDQPREIRIEQLADPQVRQILRWVFTNPEKLRPEKSTAAITAQAAGHFADLAAAMRGRGQDGQRVAHFLVQCLFCMFAEDEAVLPAGIFTDLLAHARGDTGKAARRIATLFAAMQSPGGEYGDHDIPWFNGGLFSAIDIPALTAADLAALHRAAADMDWRAIDPTIFGTLFERGLDPAARAPLGAHYTDTETIAKLIDPLIREPLLAEWDVVKAEMRAKPRKARALHQGFLLRLDRFRVLDPACGSGNFLYLALAALRDVEKRAHVDAQELGLGAELVMHTGPHNILGLEINDFAAELARVTVWIGDIQWCRRNGYPHAVNPILKPLDGIEHRDALLNPDGSEAEWPAADVITGNPPFLGDKVMRGELGDSYVVTVRRIYAGRVPGGADFVTYWFEKARAQIAAGLTQAAGLVATNSIRGGANRKVLERIAETTRIFEAWSDEPWVNEGAAVRVSLVGFGPFFGVDRSSRLDGRPVATIHADLTRRKRGSPVRSTL